MRDGEAGIETFAMRRAATMAFAAGFYVFPGGRVDERDYEQDIDFGPVSAVELARRASTDVRGVRALYACAVREVAEEVGIVLAPQDDAGRLQVDPAVLPIVDHWVTPEVERIRYDVRFLAALVPEGQEAVLSTTEADHAEWLAAVEAVERFGAGRMAMLPPTIATIQYLASFADCAAMLDDAARRRVVPLLPTRIVHEDGRVEWTIVHDTEGREAPE